MLAPPVPPHLARHGRHQRRQPLLFLVGFGAGLGRLVDQHAPAQLSGTTYAAFFAPGLLCAAAMQTAFLESSGPVTYAAIDGSYRDATPTPLEPPQIMAGHQMFVIFRVLTSSAAFVVVMTAFGLTSPRAAPAVLGGAVLTGMAFAAPVAAWAVGVRRTARLTTVFRMIVMPMYMFSGAFFALAKLPTAVRIVAETLPLAQAVILCRDLSLETVSAADAARAGYLFALTAVGLLWARRAYTGRLHA
ncbi:ABC transporter permease [Catenulispora yoronensis]